MGNFVPKPPFDLTAFLSQKATPSQSRSRGRPGNRFRPKPEVASEFAEGSSDGADEDLPKTARPEGAGS